MADTIDFDDYEVLCALAREFNEWVPPERVRSAPAEAPADVRGDRPGDEFNRRAAWADILPAHGWAVDHTSGDVTYWTRPDKKIGTSATTGKCKTEGSGDLLYVFSSNAHPFEPDAAYSKFAALAFLEHAGDFEKAASALKAEGYGQTLPPSQVIFGPAFAAGPKAERVNPVAPPDGRLFFWLSELKRLETNEKWIWNGFISRGGITLLSALWKAGKSTLLTHLVKAFGADEGQFLGREIKTTKILYVTEEDQTTWAERRDALLIGDHMGVICRPFKGRSTPVQWKEFLARIHDAVITYGFGLVVFDTLSKMWPVRDENNANQVEEALMPLWVISDLSVALLLVHHTRKSQGDNFTAARGSGSLSAFCETLIDFDRVKGGRKDSPRRVLYSGGRYTETPRKWVIELKRAPGQMERYEHVAGAEAEDDEDEAAAPDAATPVDRAPKTECELFAAVYAVLSDDPDRPLSCRAIAEKVKPWVGNAERAAFMLRMINAGHALKEGKGYVRGPAPAPGSAPPIGK